MKSFRLFWLLTVLALFTNCLCDGSVLCFENERLALLQFKDDLVDGANRLSSWSSANMDCCRWAGVVCNNVSGYVEELHLQGPDPELEEASSERLGGSINPSLLSLKQLKYLDLSCNDFQAIQIPSFIGSLQNLRYLNLSWSQFQGDVPPQLGNLSMLVVLDLRIGRWLSDFTVKRLNWLSGLSKLQYLDMSGYDLNNVSEWVQPIHTLPALTELHLSSCNLSQLPRNPTKFNFTSLTILDLSYNFFDTLMPRWIFSLSKLVSLDLSRCLFHGPVSGSGITNLNNLTDLKFLRVTENDFMSSPSVLRGVLSLKSLVLLDVSTCDISSPILGGLQNMTSLVSIDLSQNHIVETLPNSVGMLCNLIHVDLRSNNFSGSVSELLTNLSECKSPKLEYLAFSANRLSGSIPDKIGQLQNLVTFDLAFNAISGTIPYSLGRLSFLKELMLNVNSLSGPLPDSLGNLTSLYWLEISYNNFNGTLPESIGQLGNLNYLSVHHNSLTGVLTENHFANLTALDNIWAQANMLTLELSDKHWVPPFKLRVLRIGSWNLGPRFPSWLQSQGNLTDLDISNANISDVMPDWFWSTFSNIGFLNISHNRILGRFPQNLEFLATNAVVDLSDNSFDGPLPASLPDIDFLDLSRNHISGSLNQFLCPRVQESRQLKVLNLANNNLSGVIPDCWVNWDSLYVLNFENNRLSGGIPKSVGEVSLLRSLNMRKNNLTGKIPVSVMSSKSLLIIDLADNKLTGITPTANRRKATGLRLLSLRSNKLDGEFTDELCHLTSIQILDLAGNNLSGSLPTCFSNFTIMSGKESSTPIILYDEFVQDQVLGSASLVTKGRESEYSTILFLVTTLDLSGNRFSGNIPGELMDLVGLRYLNLSGNQLTGGIPDNIGDMRLLESLDLSSNLLQGRIPWTISSLTFLNWLNISYNSLTGRIPTSTQIQSLNQSSFVGNRLCGPPLQDLCISVAPVDRPKGAESTDEADEVDWVLIVCLVVGFFSGFWVVVGPLAVSKMWRITYFGFLYKVGHKVCGNCIPNPKHTTVEQTVLHLESSW